MYPARDLAMGITTPTRNVPFLRQGDIAKTTMRHLREALCAFAALREIFFPDHIPIKKRKVTTTQCPLPTSGRHC